MRQLCALGRNGSNATKGALPPFRRLSEPSDCVGLVRKGGTDALASQTIDIYRLHSRIGQKTYATGGNLVDSSHQPGAAFFEGTRPFQRVL